jgi:4-hydroxybenzoate polyprenyltransferase
VAGLKPWLELFRFHEYGPLFLLCSVAGALFARGSVSYSFLALMAFVCFLSISAFVINDVTDASDDARRGFVRNPISKGEVQRPQAFRVFLVLAFLSAVTAPFLGAQDFALSLLLFVLCWGYSLGPGFKAHPVSDLVVHSLVPALFALQGYGLYRPIGLGALLLALTVAAFSGVSGVLQEIRDLSVDLKSRRTTVVVLGSRKSPSLAMALAILGVGAFGAIPLLGLAAVQLVVFLPLGFFILQPISRLSSGDLDAEGAIELIRTRGLVLALVLMAAYAALTLAGL